MYVHPKEHNAWQEEQVFPLMGQIKPIHDEKKDTGKKESDHLGTYSPCRSC